MQIRNIFLLIPLCLAQLATAAIIQRGADGTEYGATPEAQQLWNAVRRNDIETVKNLVSESNVNSYTSKRTYSEHGPTMLTVLSKEATLLYAAACLNNLEVADLLIAKGAHVNAQDINGKTPLRLAVQRNNREVAELLIDKGAYVNTQDDDGITPLHFAAECNSCEVAELLIDKGAHVDVRDNIGAAPLRVAAKCNSRKVAELLIDKGAYVNARDNIGAVPLYWAALRNCRDVAELLISCGAQLDVIDHVADRVLRGREVHTLLNSIVPWLKQETISLQSVRQLPQEKKVSYAKMAIGQGSYGNAKTILNVCESTSRAEVLVHIMLPMQSTTATAIRDELLADNAVYAVLGQSVSYRIRNNRISGSMVSHMCHYAPDAMATYRDAHGNTLLHDMAAAGMADGCSHMLSLLTNHTRGASSQASQVKSKLQNAGGFTPRDIAEEKLHATDCVNPSKYRRFIQAYDDALARYMQQRSLHNTLKNDQLTDIDIVLDN